MPGKGQYSIDAESGSLQLSRLQARQRTDANEKVAKSIQDYNRKGVLF
jgi:hypothetical protein